MSTVSRRVAEARRHAGLTQTELGDLLGLRLGAVEQIETGVRDAWPHIPAIADATGRPLSWFASGDPVSQGPEMTVRSASDEGIHARSARAVILTSLFVLATIRAFTEALPLLPRAANFIDIPIFLLILAAAIGRPGRPGSTPTFARMTPLLYLFLGISVLSALTNLSRVEPLPLLLFFYGFLAPIALGFATYKAWPTGNTTRAVRLLLVLGFAQFVGVALFGMPKFLQTRNPDDISGTFGTNQYQMVFYLMLFATLVAGIATFEPRRLLSRFAPLIIGLCFGVILLAQYRSLLVTTALVVAFVGIVLGRARRRGVVVAGVAAATLLATLSLAIAHLPFLKFGPAVDALQEDPLALVTARVSAGSGVASLLSENPRFIATGSGPGTYSSRAWRTFAQFQSTSRSNVAGPYVARLTGGRVYRTDVADMYLLPTYEGAEEFLGSRALASPFSSYFALIAEVGPIGFVLLSLVYARAFIVAMRISLQRRQGLVLPTLALTCAVAFFLLLQMAVFENWLEVARVTFPSWIIFGIVAREADAEHTREAWG